MGNEGVKQRIGFGDSNFLHFHCIISDTRLHHDTGFAIPL